MLKRKRILSLIIVVALSFTFVNHDLYAAKKPYVEALGAIAMDYDTGAIIYEKNINTPRSAASMTKVMTAHLVYDAINDGEISMDTKIPITKEVRKMIARSPSGVRVSYGNEETVRDLLSMYLIASSCPAGTALSEYIGGSQRNFVDMMNNKAKELGIDAHYNDPHGLVANGVTPLAQAKLIRHLIQTYPEVLDITGQKYFIFHGKRYNSTNKFYRTYSWYSGVDGFKTGTSGSAGYCFSATAKRNGTRIITVAMHSSSSNQRFLDSIKMLDYAFSMCPFEYKTSEWAKDVPAKAEELGFNTAIIQGKDKFYGTEPLTRGEYIAMLVKALNLKPKDAEAFSDLKKDAWYSDYVTTARGYGYVNGTGKNEFKPEAIISRQQMALVLQNVLKLESNGKNIKFKDDARIGKCYKEAVYRMAQYGILNGTGNNRFSPLSTSNRESASKMFINLREAIDSGKVPKFGSFIENESKQEDDNEVNKNDKKEANKEEKVEKGDKSKSGETKDKSNEHNQKEESEQLKDKKEEVENIGSEELKTEKGESNEEH